MTHSQLSTDVDKKLVHCEKSSILQNYSGEIGLNQCKEGEW